MISAPSVTFTVGVESVTVLQEVTDLRVSEESEPVTQWLRLTALEAGILIEMLQILIEKIFFLAPTHEYINNGPFALTIEITGEL